MTRFSDGQQVFGIVPVFNSELGPEFGRTPTPTQKSAKPNGPKGGASATVFHPQRDLVLPQPNGLLLRPEGK